MDADELATPGYAVLTPATRTKLATLDKGQLMVRHPHFTQPIFVRFPRPAVMNGREGVERFPQASDVSLAEAVLRSLRRLDPTLTLGWVEDVVGLYEEAEVLRAKQATILAKPTDVRGYFKSQFRSRVPQHKPAPRPAPVTIRTAPDDDPYGF
jgi:hypothetical protein